MVWRCSSITDLHQTVQFCQHQLLKRLSFSHFIFLAPLLKIGHRCLGLFLESLFCSIDPYVFVPVPHWLDYCSFVILSEVWESYASCFVFFFSPSGLLWQFWEKYPLSHYIDSFLVAVCLCVYLVFYKNVPNLLPGGCPPPAKPAHHCLIYRYWNLWAGKT